MATDCLNCSFYDQICIIDVYFNYFIDLIIMGIEDVSWHYLTKIFKRWERERKKKIGEKDGGRHD